MKNVFYRLVLTTEAKPCAGLCVAFLSGGLGNRAAHCRLKLPETLMDFDLCWRFVPINYLSPVLFEYSLVPLKLFPLARPQVNLSIVCCLLPLSGQSYYRNLPLLFHFHQYFHWFVLNYFWLNLKLPRNNSFFLNSIIKLKCFLNVPISGNFNFLQLLLGFLKNEIV